MIEPDENRVIPDPGFAGDDGSAPPALATALAGWAAGRTPYAEALAALAAARLLVPVVAVLGEVEVDEQGLAHDKTSDMATVLLEGADGRLALLAFTGTEALQSWQADARPVPVTTPLAAQSAVQDGAAALVVDVAGPVRFVVEGEDLERLADGWTLARAGDRVVWIRPERESSATIKR
ncbi:MAG TPA: SseB family protein [Nocardioides sp.]|nr:SseB family protein [Nocardioides sp.]